MQVFKQILLDILNHMLPTIYTVKSLEPVLNCTDSLGKKLTIRIHGGKVPDTDLFFKYPLPMTVSCRG